MAKAVTKMDGPMVLPRAFALLDLLANKPQGMNLSAMATHIDVPKSSLSSTLKALTDQGFLSRQGSLYFLGSEAYALASKILAGRTIRQIARPYLEQTNAETGETVLLGQLDSDQQYASYIDLVESDKSIRFYVPIAARRELYASSTGRVFLAHMPEKQRKEYYKNSSFDKLTDDTVTDIDELETILAAIRENGIAITMGNYAADAAGFAVPVFNGDGILVAAVTIGVPVSRARREKQKFIDAAIAAGAAISKALGYQG